MTTPEKSCCKWESNRGSAALEGDTLTTGPGPMRWSGDDEKMVIIMIVVMIIIAIIIVTIMNTIMLVTNKQGEKQKSRERNSVSSFCSRWHHGTQKDLYVFHPFLW